MSSATFVSAFEQLAEIEQKTTHGVPGDIVSQWQQRYPLDVFRQPEKMLMGTDVRHRGDLALLLTAQAASWLNDKKWLAGEFSTVFAPYWWLLAVASVSRDACWLHPSHPIVVVFEQLLLYGRSFQPHPQLQNLLANLGRLINDVARASATGEDSALQAGLKQIQQLLNEQRQHIAENDRQLLAKEMHLLRSTHVHSAVTRAIRFAMHGKSPHAKILGFIDDVWRKYLSVIYLRVGLENDEWDRAMADIDMMLWLSDGATADEVRRALDYDVAQLIERLRKASSSIRGVDQLVDAFIDWFTSMVGDRAAELPVEVDFGLGLDDGAVNLASLSTFTASGLSDEESLLQRLRNCKSGDAIQIKTFEGWKRARFVDVDLAHDVYLIGDNLGNRLAAMGRREMANSIHAGKLALVDSGPFLVHVEPILAPIVEQLAVRWRDEYMAKLDAQKRAQEAKIMAELEARRKQEAEQRAARVAAARAQADYEQRVQHCRELAKRLRAGAMVQIENAEGKLRPAFLAMVSGGNGQYVFVERNGRRVASLPLDDVIAAMIENRLQVIESGSAIDATLSNMVKERRQFLQEEG